MNGNGPSCVPQCNAAHPALAANPIDVGGYPAIATEQMGSKDKHWLRLDDQSRWLFKSGSYRSGPNGSDWAELLVHAVALEMGAPTACIALASDDADRGVISHYVLRGTEELVHGNEILGGKFQDYVVDLRGENQHYTVRNIFGALLDLGAGGSISGFEAFDQFALYLVLDALVSGRDRHHENWAVVRSTGSAPRLAPSFDHGNGLGFTEREDRAQLIAADPDKLARWLRRGTSHNFAGRPTLIDLAVEAVGLCGQSVREEIQDRVDSMHFTGFQETMRMIPPDRMSEAHRSFATSIVEANKRRLLDAFSA